MVLLTLTAALASCSETPDIALDNEGYVCVNGVRTDYIADTDDVITVRSDGYLIVNGKTTAYRALCSEHNYRDWCLLSIPETSCERRLYNRTCSVCLYREYKTGNDEDHLWQIKETVAATCQEPGYDTVICSICENERKINVTGRAHDYTNNKYEFDDEKHWIVCDTCGSALPDFETPHYESKDKEECGWCGHRTEPRPVYSVSDDGTYAIVTGYVGLLEAVVISEEYEGLPVKVIAERAFAENATIRSVIIPESVTTIGLSAFSDCSALTNVVIEGGDTVIVDWAFNHCESLVNVILGEGTKEIRANAFRLCSIESIVIPNSVTHIGFGAFKFCKSLKEVTISEGLTEIGPYSFSRCSALTSVNIPESVKSIGMYAFEYAESLEELKLPKNIETIGDGAFRGCTSITELVIPISITSLGDEAFEDCSSLTAVYYGGDKEAWDAITTGYSYPSGIDESLIHFNSSKE